MVKVKYCCHTPSNKPRFLAHNGDRLLVNRGEGLVSVELASVLADGKLLVVPPSDERVEMDPQHVAALLLDD